MKYYNLLWCWTKNIFIFSKPTFSQLDYADYIIEDKSYFVFSWKMKNAHLIKIKSTEFKSLLKSGSAYTLIVGEKHRLEIVISGTWRSKSYFIDLKRISLDGSIEFPLKINNNFHVDLNLPTPKQKITKLTIETFKVQIVDKRPTKTITNISYPN